MLNIEENVILSKFCTWHVGGPARYFVRVSTIQDLKEALLWAQEKKLAHFVLGGGSNILFSDVGYAGLIIKIEGRGVVINGSELIVEAGAIARLAVLKASELNLGGLEHLAGIPGTIGGLVRGNAGAFGMETKDSLVRVHVLHNVGNEWKEEILERKDVYFSYRDSLFKKETGSYIIWDATFALIPIPKDVILKLVNDDLSARKDKQPYTFPSAGSVFKNPSLEISAGRLIEECGCKGLKIGGAEVSTQHANFILNKGGATSFDIHALIEEIKKRVFEAKGVKLVEEVIVL
jgi:UDP-N-acetylmuramate dehydrogenase